MRRSILLGLALGAATIGSAAAAQTSTGFGSAIYQTRRNCPATPSVACDGTGAGQGVVGRSEAGGAGRSATLGSNGDYAYATVAFGAFGFPQIKASVNASGLSRIGDNIYAYQSYIYNGAEEFDLLLAANLHIVSSTTDNSTGTHPGGAIAQASFAIWNKADFFAAAGPGFGATPLSIYSQSYLFGTAVSCSSYGPGDYAPRATTYGSRALTGGEANIGLAQTNCYEQTLTIQPGDEFVIASGVQLFGNRSATIDATGTFNVGLSPNATAADRAAFEGGVTFASDVPEPASWAMMIGGFGLVGGAMRRRRSPALTPA